MPPSSVSSWLVPPHAAGRRVREQERKGERRGQERKGERRGQVRKGRGGGRRGRRREVGRRGRGRTGEVAYGAISQPHMIQLKGSTALSH